MASSSNNILQNCLNEISVVSATVSTNMIIDSPTVPIQNELSSNVTLDGFQQVENKKKKKIKRKLATSATQKKRTRYQTNIISKPVASSPLLSMPDPMATEPVLHKIVQHVGDTHHVQDVQQVQKAHGLQDIQPVSNDPEVQGALPASHPEQISITTESTRYAQTRYPFPPFIIRFNSGKVTSNKIKEGLIAYCNQKYQMEINILNCRLSNRSSNNDYDFLVFLKDASSFSFLLDQNHWPSTFSNEDYTFPYSPSIPPQLSLLIKNVDLRLDFNEFCQEIKTRYPQIKNVIRLKNKFNNDIKLVKLELTSSSVREELLLKRKITVDYIVYDIDEYLAPANILICSKCMGLGHFMKQCTQVKSTCRTCGDCADDLKLHVCSKIEKCIHCGQNHKSNSLKCQVVKSFRSELTRKLLSSINCSTSSTTNNINNMSNSGFKYFSSEFPSMPTPQYLPTNHNNTMLTKLDDLLGKITEVNNHLSNLESKYNKFEQFKTEKQESDLIVKENLNLFSKQSIEFKKDLVHHSLLIERHDNLFIKLIIPMFEDLFGLIASQNQDKKGNILDIDLKLKLERYLIQMKKAKEILEEWESSSNLYSCFSQWQSFTSVYEKPSSSSFHVLLFNVRGLDFRWQEVLLLISSFKFDALILLETGDIDISFYQNIFCHYRLLYQKGENRNGGVLMLMKEGISISRVPCKLPNVCVVDVKGEDAFRLIGVYAPDSKTWLWDDLSHFLSKKCIIYGDFNVDIMQDGKKAEILLQWADDQFLAQALPNSSTSLRSDRVIDYAFVRGFNIDIQVYNGNTTSDHRPILSVIPLKVLQQKLGKNTHWKVFKLFSEYTFSFWEENWNLSSIDITYNDYIRFLHLLSARCSTFFYLDRYRSALPVELRSFLSYIRALSFRQIRTQCDILKKEVCFLKKIAKKELNLFFSSQLDNLLRHRNSSSSSSNSFWYRSKRFLKPSSSSLHAFLDSSGQIVKESDLMCNIAADYYEEFFKASNIVRPHPYTDSPAIECDNINEVIPEVKLDELINTVLAKKKKISRCSWYFELYI
ncbi:unnamed protein product [Rotaria socialis]|uniref:Uncharacterized protein n=1 Tax=Rotaria socialis TaxID=392032 RepID=A0A818E5V4_9BILA|nr:unnamed protein product [Rotaria socialis]